MNTQNQPKIGQIFYTSWGYDQTNTEFMKIVEITATGKTAKCVMLKNVQVDAWNVKPGEAKGVVFRMKIDVFHDEAILRGTYPYCEGDTQFGSAYPLKEESAYQTAANYGH